MENATTMTVMATATACGPLGAAQLSVEDLGYEPARLDDEI